MGLIRGARGRGGLGPARPGSNSLRKRPFPGLGLLIVLGLAFVLAPPAPFSAEAATGDPIIAATGRPIIAATGRPVIAPSDDPVIDGSGDPVIAAAGDIACDPGNSYFNGGAGTSANCAQARTAALLGGPLAAVLPLGDDQYYCGSLAAFLASYDKSWGVVKSISRPVVGNHEYLTSGGTGCDSTNGGAAGHFAYFGSLAGTSGAGYYSYNIGTWHLIALNSNCSDVGGCSASSAQGKWLAADLASHGNVCTLAYWHIPLFSSGGRASSNTKALWDQLYAAGVDVVLNGHDHIYERFARQNPAGLADPVNGIRQFTVGTGGADHTSVTKIAANSEVRNGTSYGVLKLTLHPGSYAWNFVPAAGASFTDSGSEACVGAGGPSPTSDPSPAASPTPSAAPTTGPSGGSVITLKAISDSYVNADSPGANYGTSTALRADASPVLRTYIRFTLPPQHGTIVRATLQFLPKANHPEGVSVFLAQGVSWSETNLTFNNAPTYGPAAIGTSGWLVSGTWASVDVTSAAKTASTVTFVLVTTSSTQATIASRETTDPPVLVLELNP